MHTQHNPETCIGGQRAVTALPFLRSRLILIHTSLITTFNCFLAIRGVIFNHYELSPRSEKVLAVSKMGKQLMSLSHAVLNAVSGVPLKVLEFLVFFSALYETFCSL